MGTDKGSVELCPFFVVHVHYASFGSRHRFALNSGAAGMQQSGARKT